MIHLVSPAATNNRSLSASVRLLLFPLLRLFEAEMGKRVVVATKHANFDVLFLSLSRTRRIRRKDEIAVIFNVSPDFISMFYGYLDFVFYSCLSRRYLTSHHLTRRGFGYFFYAMRFSCLFCLIFNFDIFN